LEKKHCISKVCSKESFEKESNKHLKERDFITYL